MDFHTLLQAFMYLNALKKKELNVFSYFKKKKSVGFFLLSVVFPSFLFLFWGEEGGGEGRKGLLTSGIFKQNI